MPTFAKSHAMRPFAVCAIFVFLAAGVSQAGPAKTAITEDQVSISLQAPAFSLQSDDQGVTSILLGSEQDRYSFEQPAGQPLLPHRTVTLALPPDADLNSLEVQVDSAQVDSLAGGVTLPLAQPQTVSCVPAADQACIESETASGMAQPWLHAASASQPLLALASASADASASVKLLPAGQLRKWRFARLDFAPFQYDSQGQTIKVVRSLQAHVSFRRDPALLDPALLNDSTMDDVAARLLDNYDQATAEYESARLANPVAAPLAGLTTYDYVIVTTSDIANHSNVGSLIAFLTDHGHSVDMVPTYQIDSTAHGEALADKIRAWLKANVSTFHIRYVLLLGDPNIDASESTADEVPMKKTYPNHADPAAGTANDYVYTDAYYANLFGNWDLNGNGYYGEAYGTQPGDIGNGGLDLTPDVFVGRIPMENNDFGALNAILQKTINFESRTAREAWQNKVILPMTFIGTNFDTGAVGNKLKNNVLAPQSLISYEMYMRQYHSGGCNDDMLTSYAYNQVLTDNSLANYWSANPSGLVVWSGHGNTGGSALGYGWPGDDCWSGNLFSWDQAPYLNDAQPAFVFGASCLNNGVEDSNNVTYNLLKNGAISMVASTFYTENDPGQDSWASIAGNYHTGLGVAYHYTQNLVAGDSTSEAMLYERTVSFPDSNFDLQTMLGYNVNGEPSAVYIVPSTAVPNAPQTLHVSRTLNLGHSHYTLTWTDASSNEEFFRIYLHATDNTYNQMRAAARNATTWTFDDLPCGKTYQFYVTAVNRTGESGPSNTVSQDAYPCVPVHPTTISAHLSGVDTVVNWDDPNQNEDGYKVYRIERIGNYYVFPWTQVGTVGPNVTTFTDSHPACEHTFLYRVTAYNISGESGSSPSITIGSQVCPPAAPSGLGYTSTQTSVTLTWQDNSNNEAGFEVLWRLMPNMAWLHLADVPPDTEQYIESGLVCSGAPLLYEVRAYNDGGQAYSGQISGVTQPCTPPAAPDGLAVDANSFNPNSLFLEWNDNSDNEDGFRIEKWNGSGWDAPFATTNPDVTDFQVTGLTCNTPYTFRVGAFNNYGEAYSAQASGTTAACSTDNMPKDLTATGISTSEIDLTWSQGGLATPTGYHVARYNPLMRNPWAVIATVSGTSYPDTGLSCGTTYYYKVNAYRDTPIVFTSDYTDVVSATTVECPPPAPHLLSVLPTSQSSLTVTWSVLRGSYDGFEVYRAPYPLPPIPLWIKIGTPDGAARSFVSDRLLCGTQYSYRVRAFNDGGYSAFSTSAMGQTLPCSPDAPDILAMASNTAASIDLTWHEASADVTGYHLERSPDGSSGWTEINVSTTNTPSYSDPGLTCGTPYFYRVYAYNTGGISTYSDVLAAATAACTPALVAQAGIQGLVTLSWSDSGHTATEYKLERSPNGTSGWTDLFPTTTITGSPQKDTNAPCGATLYYHIRALSADGNSPFSSPSQAVTVCKPTTSMNLSVARTSLTKAHLTWTATSGGQDHFRIERMIKGQYGWENLGTVSAATLQFMDTNIPDGVVYIYRIVAVNQGGETYSNMAQLNAQYHYRIPIIRK